MSDRPEDRTPQNTELPPDVPEADVLEQARPWAGDEEERLPPAIPDDAPEADALDQARTVELGEDDEEPA